MGIWVFSSTAAPQLTLSPVEAAAGQTVTVSLALANDAPLPSLNARLDYNLNRVRVLSYRAIGRAPAPQADGDDGQGVSIIIDTAIPAGDGSIIEIDFQVRAEEPAGIIPLTLSADIAADSGYIRVPATGPPSLSLTLSAASALEANPPVIGTVTLTNVASLNPTRISLQSADSARAAVPAFVDIPSVANSASFEIQLPNDSVFGPDVDVLITASADFGSDSVTLHVRDDDNPADPSLIIGAASPGTPTGLFSNTVTIDDLEIAESASVTFSVSAGQGAREALDFRWTFDGQEVANSASFTFAPGFEHIAHPAEFADHQLICTVANSANATWNFRVTDTDRPPTPEIVVSFHPLAAQVTPVDDPDGDALLGLDIHWEAPDGSTVDGDTAVQAGADETWILHVIQDTAPYGTVISHQTTRSVTYPNTPPVAEDASFSIDPDTPLAIDLPGSDIDDEPLIFSISRQPQGQITALDAATGSLSYQPPAGFAGIDSFDYEVSGLATARIEIWVGVVSFELALVPGWNLISLPIDPVATPPALRAALAWRDGFQVIDQLQAGVGYFVLHRQRATQIRISGTVPAAAPLPVAGWNLLGVVGAPPYSSQSLPGAWSLIGGHYRQVDTILPGRGYWWYSNW